jgi:glycosyltransferase involved in cell wall biosynthesis
MIADLVSTVIPVYNRPDLLREAVACVLAQAYRPIEILIVDDGSTDETPDVAGRLAESHPAFARVIRKSNGGPGSAREAGRVAARGEFLQYLDSDDRIHPRKFEAQVAALRRHPECGVAYCRTREYQIGEAPKESPSCRTGERFDNLFPELLAGRCWQTVTPLIRRSVSDAAGPWSDLRQEEDWEYDARLAALGTRLAWCPEFLADFRHHPGERAGGNSLRDPVKMRWRQRAHVLIFGHARRAGIGPEQPAMRRFARELFLLARQCGAAGLADESRELFELAREASGPARRGGLDFRLYRGAAAVLGWRGAGRLSCWADRFRPPPLAAPPA